MERVEEAIRERRVAVTAIINATSLIVTQEKRCESGKKRESESKKKVKASAGTAIINATPLFLTQKKR